MTFFTEHTLTVLIFLPLVAGLLAFFIPQEDKKSLFIFGLNVALVEFVLSLALWKNFTGQSSYEFVEVIPWIKSWNIFYRVGIDGVSLLLVLLTTFLMPLVFLASFSYIKDRVKEYIIALLFLQAGMIGVFCALDLFLFYVFWEVMLVPMYLIIGIWGGKDKIYATVKFFIYTMAGSLLMLVGILALYFHAGKSFNFFDLYQAPLGSLSFQIWVFLSFALAFAIKVPLFPFHTWLPNAHVEAPTAGSVILAGVLLKMGTYGFFRFAMPLFPQAFYYFQPALLILCVIGIVYGALVAMVQTDIKKLIAYSSVSHLGVVMLGLFSLNVIGVTGGLYQMISHGISTGMLFLIVGMIYERTHSREIAAHSGLAKIFPIATFFFLVATLASIGLPLTNGFIGEFLSFTGTFQKYPVYALIGATSVVLGAIYMLWLIQRFFFGEQKIPGGSSHDSPVHDLNKREIFILIPLVVLIFWMGVYPKTFLDKLERPVQELVERMKSSPLP